MTKLSVVAALIASLASVQAMPQLHKREILTPLPANADSIETKFQPAYDFDSDGCYQTAAVDPSGKLNAGKKLGGNVNGQCRDEIQLDHSNTYSRRRCNNGICGILYDNYYEKDQSTNGVGEIALDGNGHKHDWENIVVFVRMKDQAIIRVAVSKHHGYEARDSGFLLDGTHPLVVYHKDGGFTHCNRFANQDDVDHPENPKKKFWRAPLVGWLGWADNKVRDSMTGDNWGGARPKIAEDQFADWLEKAGASGVGLNPHGPDDYLL